MTNQNSNVSLFAYHICKRGKKKVPALVGTNNTLTLAQNILITSFLEGNLGVVLFKENFGGRGGLGKTGEGEKKVRMFDIIFLDSGYMTTHTC